MILLLELLTRKVSPLPNPKLEINIFTLILILSRGQYNGDVVVPLLRTVIIKGEHGSYVSKKFERPHYVPLKIFDTISINTRDEAGDLVAFEHGQVIITLHFRRSKTRHFI